MIPWVLLILYISGHGKFSTSSSSCLERLLLLWEFLADVPELLCLSVPCLCCFTWGFLLFDKRKSGKQPSFRQRLEMLAACTFFPSVISRKLSEKLICYYAGFVFPSHMHVGTETKPSNLSPVQSSVRAHCFEVTTHPLWVDLRGSGHKAKVNGIT